MKHLSNKTIPSVNFHLWKPCNMKCKFCFATFQDVNKIVLPKGHLPKNQAIEIIHEIAKYGFKKITFVGGEPTLCPWLSDLIKTAKVNGLTTMIVTNGTKLTNEFLENNRKYLDWIALSIDSLDDDANNLIGRKTSNNRTLTKENYLSIINKIKKLKYGLKINTVINSYNYLEDMNDFIKRVNPKRWKVLQVLPIQHQNDKYINELKITKKQFEYFVNNHKSINNVVFEYNNNMKGSYVMIDPAGRFFENSNGIHNYSTPILDIGIEKAIKEMKYDYNKFIDRKGLYNWSLKRMKK